MTLAIQKLYSVLSRLLFHKSIFATAELCEYKLPEYIKKEPRYTELIHFARFQYEKYVTLGGRPKLMEFSYSFEVPKVSGDGISH